MNNALHQAIQKDNSYEETMKTGRKLLSYIYNCLIKENVKRNMSNKLQSILNLTNGEENFINQTISSIWSFVRRPAEVDTFEVHVKQSLEFRLRTYAAIFFWMEPQFTAKDLHKRFNIDVQQFRKIAEKISYLLDIFSLAATNIVLEGNVFDRRAVSSNISQELRKISQAMYFQLPYEICPEFNIKLEDISTPIQAAEVRKLQRIADRLKKYMSKVKKKKKMSNKERQFMFDGIDNCIIQMKTIDERHRIIINDLFEEVFEWRKKQI